MATITISLTGSAIVTGSKSYTVSDADLQSVLNLMSGSRQFIGTTPTNQQLLLAWVQQWIDETKANVQRMNIMNLTPPPPITIS